MLVPVAALLVATLVVALVPGLIQLETLSGG
jgi:hypothetical protein